MLWSGTSLEGDPFEYTGTAKELLIGFLFALAILAPIYLAYFLIGIEAERAKAFASVPLVLFFYAFGQFAIFRARRYRATRTVWRGVRFWMTGSGWAYSWRACLWSLFALVTLGLAEPWREAVLERYKMRHLHYGDLSGRFEGTGWDLFKRGWWLWLCRRSSSRLSFIFSAHVIARVLPIAPDHRGAVHLCRLPGDPLALVGFAASASAKCVSSPICARMPSMGLYWATIGWMLLIVVAGGVTAGLLSLLMPVVFTGHFSAAAIPILASQHPYLMLGSSMAILSGMRPLGRRCHPGPARARGMGARGELGHRL